MKIDFSDEHEEKEKEVVVAAGGKKKRAAPTTQAKAKVKITGRKENVEEAKKRIVLHAERLVSSGGLCGWLCRALLTAVDANAHRRTRPRRL